MWKSQSERSGDPVHEVSGEVRAVAVTSYQSPVLHQMNLKTNLKNINEGEVS